MSKNVLEQGNDVEKFLLKQINESVVEEGFSPEISKLIKAIETSIKNIKAIEKKKDYSFLKGRAERLMKEAEELADLASGL